MSAFTAVPPSGFCLEGRGGSEQQPPVAPPRKSLPQDRVCGRFSRTSVSSALTGTGTNRHENGTGLASALLAALHGIARERAGWRLTNGSLFLVVPPTPTAAPLSRVDHARWPLLHCRLRMFGPTSYTILAFGVLDAELGLVPATAYAV